MPIRRCSLLLCFTLVCASLRAEEIQLQDGTKISGRVTGVSGDSFQVRTDYGDIQVPRGKIISITFPENQPKAETKDAAKAPRVFDESFDGTTYTNKTENFRANVPQGWVLAPEVRAQTPDIAAAFSSPDQTSFFFVTPEKFPGTLATYEVLVQTQYQTTFKDYEKVSESQVQIDGRAGIRLVWRGKNTAAHDAPIKALVYILPYDNRMVRLSFLTLEPLFDVALPTFEKIAFSYESIETGAK